MLAARLALVRLLQFACFLLELMFEAFCRPRVGYVRPAQRRSRRTGQGGACAGLRRLDDPPRARRKDALCVLLGCLSANNVLTSPCAAAFPAALKRFVEDPDKIKLGVQVAGTHSLHSSRKQAADLVLPQAMRPSSSATLATTRAARSSSTRSCGSTMQSDSSGA